MSPPATATISFFQTRLRRLLNGTFPMVKERLVEGVLVIGGTIPDELILALQQRAVPLVLLYPHQDSSC